MRTSMRAVVAVLVLGALALAAILVVAADRTERGTGAPRADPRPAPGLQTVSLGARAASDYDPAGDQAEHSDETTFVLDRVRQSTWSTETYQGGALGGKVGVGIYVDANPKVAAEILRVTTPSPGFRAEVYAAETGPPDELEGWTRVAEDQVVDRDERIQLERGGREYRYYLLWITGFAVGEQKAEIAELQLLRRR
jgi:serine/threonine-protein kinase